MHVHVLSAMGLSKSVVFIVIMAFVAFAVSSCIGATAGEVWGYHKSNAVAAPPPEKRVDDAKEAWTGWAMDKISEKLGFISRYKFTGAAKNTKGKITHTASG